MDKYLYDARTNAFYPLSLESEYQASGLWPAAGVMVDEKVFTQYQSPPSGKVRIAGKDGYPAWGDIQPPSQEEHVAAAKYHKAALLAEASAVITPLADASAGGYIDDADQPRLAAWQRYRYELTKVDISTAPDITWPVKPAV